MGEGASGAFGTNGHSADPERWRRVQELFQAALELPLDARAGYLDRCCREDHQLRDEVASLLDSDARAGDFIEQPAARLLADSASGELAPRFRPGDTVGRYEITALLGAGGIGEVYRARDTRLGREVALKVPRAGDAGRRLLYEAQHASVLNHPNICAVYEAEGGADVPFIVLELVEGPTLHQVLQQRRVTPAEAMRWAAEIATALDHAHRRGIVHRDLKSANVALSQDGSVKILDFGLSRRITFDPRSPHTPAAILSDASVAGTLTHIAPEVLRGEPVDHRIDLWALGILLYEMASGVLPFKGTSPLATVTAILESTPEPPLALPAAARRIVQRCLDKDPDRRYQSASEVRDALQQLQRADEHARRRRREIALAGVILTAALLIPRYLDVWPAASRPGAPTVLAVMPFANDGSADELFFADGVTEAVIGELGRIDGIRVVGAGTTLRARPAVSNPRELAQAVGASRVIEGSVSRTAIEVRLSARLLDAATGRVVWLDAYRRSLQDVQALHADLAADVARAVRIDLPDDDARRLGTVRAVDPAVYEAYLKGRYHWNQRTPASIRTAVSYFEAALELDPTYAPAYAALADCYNQLGTVMVGGGSPMEWRPKAANAAIKALQIEPDLAEAHATLGYVRHYDWQWTEAEASFRRAIALNPNNPLARIWYANFLCSRLRLDEAVREVMLARDLDPLSLIISTNVGWVLYMARRTNDAIEQFQKTLSLDPTYQQAQSRLVGAYLAAGRFDEALQLSDAIARATSQNIGGLVSAEQAKMLAGRPNDFERLLDDTVRRLPERYVSPGALANFYFSFGGRRDEDGFRWLERAYQERTNNIAYLAVEPLYDRVRNHPRFKTLVAAAGLP